MATKKKEVAVVVAVPKRCAGKKEAMPMPMKKGGMVAGCKKAKK